MTSSDKKPAAVANPRPRKADRKGRHEPEWAAGLKRLYDSVLDEPLPDSFKDLLSKLDDGKA